LDFIKTEINNVETNDIQMNDKNEISKVNQQPQVKIEQKQIQKKGILKQTNNLKTEDVHIVKKEIPLKKGILKSPTNSLTCLNDLADNRNKSPLKFANNNVS